MLLPLLLLACTGAPASLDGTWLGGATCEQTWDYTAVLHLEEVEPLRFEGSIDHTVSETTTSMGEEVRVDLTLRGSAVVEATADEGMQDLSARFEPEELICGLWVDGEEQATTCAELGLGLSEDPEVLRLGSLRWDGADRIALLDRVDACTGALLRAD